MKTEFLRAFILSLAFAAGAASAAGDPGATVAPQAPKDPVLARVAAATSQKDWVGAQSILKDALEREPRNADYHNLYAYSIRKGANPDMSLVFKHYNEALSIEPKHREAHEYLGEAYLMVGNVAKAKEHLAQLDKICFFSCSEFTDLKNAIADYERTHAAAR
jgi:tetratricopeptide (TPR) repeat protein